MTRSHAAAWAGLGVIAAHVTHTPLFLHWWGVAAAVLAWDRSMRSPILISAILIGVPTVFIGGQENRFALLGWILQAGALLELLRHVYLTRAKRPTRRRVNRRRG